MKNFLVKFLSICILATTILFSSSLVFAQPATPSPTPEAEPTGLIKCGKSSELPPDATPEQRKSNECTLTDLLQLVLNIINFLLSWAWLIATLMIVWAGWGMINAGGNDEAISAAKTTLTNAIIGFALILMSFVLLNFVVSMVTGEGTFGTQKLLEAFDLVL